MAIAGRVAMIPKGDYDATVTYQILDVVRYNDASYVAKKSSTGILPTDTEYWMLMTQDGLLVDDAFSETSERPVQNKVVNEAIQDILNGTTPAGDSNKLGGKGASEYALQSAVDKIQTVIDSMITTSGWYRVAEIGTVSVDGSAGMVEFTIKRAFGNTNNEYHHLRVRPVYGSVLIDSLDSRSRTQLITKIRCCVDSTNKKTYLEIYYSGNVTNRMNFIVSNPIDGQGLYWQAITPTLTEETVDGVTVSVTYDIPSNTKPATTADLANYLPKTGGKLTASSVPLILEATATYRPLLQFIGTDGVCGYFGYYGTDKPCVLMSDNKTLYHILHSGNVGNYALPIGGGEIAKAAASPLYLHRTNGTNVWTGYKGQDAIMGFLGFSGADNPVYTSADGTKINPLHHDGNSAKVVQDTSAPSDTTAVWVDTANKVIKIYKDGAWTALA